jgi:hypothetical protein
MLRGLLAFCLFVSTGITDCLAGSRLLATSGATSIEGSAGGGIIPWAMLAGYGDSDEWACTAAPAYLRTSDYALQTGAIACSFRNRLELSFAEQSLDLDGLRDVLSLPPEQQLRQRVIGLKLRLAGDIVYGKYGQLSLGVMHKSNYDADLASAAGAQRGDDMEAFLSGGKLFIDGPFGQMLYLNINVRWTRANQGGLLGFGGDQDDSRGLYAEVAAAVFPRRDLALGVEYRQKPDNLGFATENDWRDVFIAWFPNKHVSVVAAWVDLGNVASLGNQHGPYISVTGSF